MAAPEPTLMVIDAATEVLHLGLRHAGHDRVRALPGGPAASQTLLPALQALLQEAGLAWSAVDAFGFGRGPGAFTGVRTACAVAQGLAFGLGRPVLALDTLEAVLREAWPEAAAPPAGTVAWVAADARMGEVYAAAWRRGPAGWSALAEPALADPVALAGRAVAEAAWVAGSSLRAHAEAWSPWRSAGLPARPQASPGGAALLALAGEAWAAGRHLDPAEALPHYVRDKVAQTTAERAAARAAAAAG